MSVRDLGAAAGAEHGDERRLGRSPSPPAPLLPLRTIEPSATSPNLIRFLCAARRSGRRPRPSRLRKPGLLLALRPRHADLELRWTHLSGRPGRERSASL